MTTLLCAAKIAAFCAQGPAPTPKARGDQGIPNPKIRCSAHRGSFFEMSDDFMLTENKTRTMFRLRSLWGSPSYDPCCHRRSRSPRVHHVVYRHDCCMGAPVCHFVRLPPAGESRAAPGAGSIPVPKWIRHPPFLLDSTGSHSNRLRKHRSRR